MKNGLNEWNHLPEGYYPLRPGDRIQGGDVQRLNSEWYAEYHNYGMLVGTLACGDWYRKAENFPRKETDMNLNELAKKVTKEEGKKVNLSIAQVKEVIRIVFTELNAMHDPEILSMVRRYDPERK